MGNPDQSGAFKQQLVELLPSLRAFARSLCGDRVLADDMVQESVLKAWAARDRFEMGTNLKAWIYTILRNQYYSHLRKREREVEDADEEMASRLGTTPNQIDKLALKDLGRLLMLLPKNQREALLLVGASGFSYEEAAEICGCAVGTIKSRISRGRESLAGLLEEDGTVIKRRKEEVEDGPVGAK